MFRLVVVLCLCTLVISKTNAAKILCVFPTPSFSHQIVYRSLTQELAKRGHDVIVITTHPAFPPGESPANLTEIDMFNASHHILRNEISKVYNVANDEINIIRIYLTTFTKIFEKQFQTKEVQDLIKNERASIDLLILESNVIPTLGLVHVFDAPVIQTSSFGPMPDTYSLFGSPSHPLLYPTSVLQQRFYNLTIWESLHNMYKNAKVRYSMSRHECEDNDMLRRNLGLDILPLSNMYDRVHLFLQTVYPIWMSNPPVSPGIVYLGGLHQKRVNTLPQDLQGFLDSSKNGVIYVSFGTNVHPSLLSQDKIDMMTKVFSSLPYEILWKRDVNVTNNANNIKISTWLPQSELLYHPKVKLFITQGGLQSTEEGITAGVPFIGIPIFGDQWLHTENYIRLKIGLQLIWNTLSEDEFTRAIVTVMGDKSYKENVVRLRNIMNDQPLSAIDRAVWWTEYVLRIGGARHLLPASANISWGQYYEIELILIVVFLVICTLSALTLVILRIVRCIYNRKTQRRHSKII